MTRPLHIGITCYPTLGGSGIVGTEIGLAMAARGHQVHFVCYDTPRRFEPRDGVFFHDVVVPDYPVFHREPYALALASKLVEVSRWERLDLIHVHYALPHATSAFLARSVLGAEAPKVITTVHGTDVTLVGLDASYRPITRFSLEASDAVTAPSQFLRRVTRDSLGFDNGDDIEVIPNFVDASRFVPAPHSDERLARLFGDEDELQPDAPTLMHVSNFRPVKRTWDVIEIFARVCASGHPARLVLVGDGPDRSRAEGRVRELGLAASVRFLGRMTRFIDILQQADVFLLPSETESFGLAALEAMSCGVPVVASAVGGLPEVIEHGRTGLLAPVGDVEAHAAAVCALLDDPPRRAALGRAARQTAAERFALEPAIDRYEALYRRVLQR